MKLKTKITALFAVGALALVGCTDNSAAENAGQKSSDAGKNVTADESLKKLLPEDIQNRGTLIVGTDAAYPPNEYKDPSGKPKGWNVDLVEALGKKLGVKIEWQIASFDSIIPNVQGGRYDMGSSSFTDTVERQKSVDFVDYYKAGSLWASAKGKTVDPDKACGLTVAVQATTVQDTEELPAKDKACQESGKPGIKVLKFDDQPEVNNAVITGKADAMSADSPVTLDAIAKSSGKLEKAGKLFDEILYGFIAKKGSKTVEAIQKGVEALVKDGTYEKILKDHGVVDGKVDKIVKNGAKK
ncbi:MAG: ABC transporter substrate-binding protein [Microbacteriaceae bacterium]|nr:ABC transporter substrate-binding protein [Microbacteriaceae bacterium]